MPKTPIYAHGRVIGHIVKTPRGSHFVQAKRVPRGYCVNLGLTFKKGQ